MGGRSRRYRFFRSRAFNYQFIRTLGHASSLGAEPSECVEALTKIREGDPESWYHAWHACAEDCEKLAVSGGDAASRGRALLRASNYYRACEFFLRPDDPRRAETSRRQADTFSQGLKTLAVPHRIWKVPYERYTLRAYYLPGDPSKPLLIVCGGFDSTLEELFFWVGKAALDRAHPCILFEGPGQSAMLRDYGVNFITEWEKPLMRVLDHARWEAPEIDGCRRVLIGISMGGMLALRAASRDKRIHAAVCHCGFFSMENAALMRLPAPARWAYRLGMKGLFDSLAVFASSRDMDRRWALDHGKWVFGVSSPFDLLARTSDFSLAPVANDITCDVLVVQATRDHLIPHTETELLRKGLKRTRSIKIVTLGGPSGEHCQAGAVERFHQVLFGWIEGLVGYISKDPQDTPRS